MLDNLDSFGRIEKLAINKVIDPYPIIWSSELVKNKLDWYRSYFGKIQDLQDCEFLQLRDNIATFFNLKPTKLAATMPKFLVRISNNENILRTRNEKLTYLSEVKDLMSPPPEKCNYGRCNLEGQAVTYCGLDEASAYWETKPKRGDVITVTRFLLKESEKLVCSVIAPESVNKVTADRNIKKVYDLIDQFFVDVFTLPVARDRPRDYLFSALLSSEQLFYPVESPDNIQAIIYPSVQRQQSGQNIAILTKILTDKYYIMSVETRFILDEYDDKDPRSQNITTDQLIGSFYSYSVDYENGKILYSTSVGEIFGLFRSMQTSSQPQVRFDNSPNIPKNLEFNLSPEGSRAPEYLKDFIAKPRSNE